MHDDAPLGVAGCSWAAYTADAGRAFLPHQGAFQLICERGWHCGPSGNYAAGLAAAERQHQRPSAAGPCGSQTAAVDPSEQGSERGTMCSDPMSCDIASTQ